MLKEDDLTQTMVSYLQANGYRIRQQLRSTQRGIDIIAEDKQAQKLYLEVKGDTSGRKTSNRYGEEFSSKQIRHHTAISILQTLKAMEKHKGEDASFGIVLPQSHEAFVSSVLPSLQQLGIKVYIVSPERKVKQL